MSKRVPWAVERLVESYRGGEVQQKTYSWRQDSFERYFFDRADLIVGLPGKIGRADVVDRCRRIVDVPTAEHAFVASMVWGFGTGDNRGAWRTRQMIDDPGAGEKLLLIARCARQGPPVAAFREAAANRIRLLGPSFWTKFLCFCSLADRDREVSADPGVAPILDSRLSSWVNDETGESISFWDTTGSAYERYVSLLNDWAEQVDLRVDVIEELIFRSTDSDEHYMLRGKWNEQDKRDHQAIERFRFHFHDRMPQRLTVELDELEAVILARSPTGSTTRP